MWCRVTARRSTAGGPGRPLGWRQGEDGGIPGGAVICVEIGWNTSGEGGHLALP
jgi:hypothetical protein